MRRRSRTARALKWTGAILTAFMLFTWAYAATHVAGVCYPNWCFELRNGSLHIMRFGGSQLWMRANWFNVRCSPEVDIFYWKTGRLLDMGSRAIAELHLPLWMPLVAAAVLTALLSWVDSRFRFPPGHCQKCGYDLTGNVSGRSPECGTEMNSRHA